MRKALVIALLLVSVFAHAGDLDTIVLSIDSVQTNATAAFGATNVYGMINITNALGNWVNVQPATRVSGKIKSIVVNVIGVAPDIDIDIRTRTQGALGVTRNIYSADDVTADVEVPLVQQSQQVSGGAVATNWYQPMILFSDEIELLAYDAATNNVNVDVTIILER